MRNNKEGLAKNATKFSRILCLPKSQKQDVTSRQTFGVGSRI